MIKFMKGKNMENIIEIIPSIMAVISIILTFLQIKLSNKQTMLDKRIDLYIKASGF